MSRKVEDALKHYSRPLYVERPSLAQEAHRHILHAIGSYMAMGLPVEHVYHEASDTENIVIPIALEQALESALKDAGFKFVPKPEIVRAEELRERLIWVPKTQVKVD